jgi:sulfur carrier protein
MGSITVTLNGTIHNTSANTIGSLLNELGFIPSQVIVELNGEILTKQTLLNTQLAPNDTVEIIRYIGGGKLKKNS